MNQQEFQLKWQETAKRVEAYLRNELPLLIPGQQLGLKKLRESMEYSTYEGGKRFRPVLCLWAFEALGGDWQKALPLAASIEMVHCYSLIHDDLPCMDNDDLRRGRPTNHKVYGDAMALLAGNTLMTEVFTLLAEKYKAEPAMALELIRQVAGAAGGRGMIGGQALDISADAKDLSLADVEFLHALKTGALIRVAATSAATLGGAGTDQSRALKVYGEQIGLAFQIADDLLDFEPENIEPASYPALVGVSETRKLLDETTETAIAALKIFDNRANRLRELALFNRNRTN